MPTPVEIITTFCETKQTTDALQAAANQYVAAAYRMAGQIKSHLREQASLCDAHGKKVLVPLIPADVATAIDSLLVALASIVAVPVLSEDKLPPVEIIETPMEI